MTSYRLWGLCLISLIYAADQGSKQWILDWFGAGNPAIITTSFMNFILAGNRGISFGMMQMHSPVGVYMLIGAVSILICILGKWFWTAQDRLSTFSLSLIIGGALGNVTDRILYGRVIDFIDCHYAGYHWYTFNIADCGVVVGVILLVIQQIFAPLPTEKTTEE